MRHSKPTRLIADLVKRRHAHNQSRKLSDALSDPHLARDIGLPHQPRPSSLKPFLW